MYNSLTLLTQSIRSSDQAASSGGSGGSSGGGTGVSGAVLTDYIGRWTMDNVDTTATSVLDTGSGGINMSLVNTPTIGVTGQKGQAVTFSKFLTQYGTIPQAMTSALSDFTIIVRFNTSFASQAQTFFDHYHNQGGIASGVTIGIAHTGELNVVQADGTGNVVDTDIFGFDTTSQWNDGNWHEIAYTYDLGTTTGKLYVDGVLELIRTDVAGIAWPTTVEVGVGAILGSFPLMVGSLDEIKIFDYDLTNTQVEDTYIQDGGSIPVVPPVDYIGYYTMDIGDITGATHTDKGSKLQNMTLVNTPITGGAGQLGTSVYFDLATSQYATIPNAMLVGETDVGIGIWYKSSHTSLDQELITEYSQQTGPSLYGFEIILKADGSLEVNTGAGTGLVQNTDYWTTTSVTSGTNDGNWHMAFASYNSTTNIVSLYVDGILEATTTGVTGLAWFAAELLYVGGVGSLTSAIDNIKIFDYAPSNQEVLSLYSTDGGT